MRRLILVKHAMPEIDPTVSAAEWVLSAAGRAQAQHLAGRLMAYDPHVVVSSHEPKAKETAAVVAQQLDLPVEVVSGLHEHDRWGVAFLEDAAFRAAVSDFFANPSTLVFGRETADEAHARFHGALAAITARYPSQNLVVVAHGTVITLFVARITGMAPYALWARLGLPSYVVLSWPEAALLEVVEHLGPNPA